MTKIEFAEIVKIIKSTFPRMDFSNSVMDAWYECLGDLDYQRARSAVVSVIKESEYAPTIALIRKEYKQLASGDEAIKRQIENHFEQMKSHYPGQIDDAKSWQEFSRVCTDVRKAEWVHGKVTDLIYDTAYRWLPPLEVTLKEMDLKTGKVPDRVMKQWQRGEDV